MEVLKKKIMLGKYIDVRRLVKFTKKTPIRILSGPRGDGKSTSIQKGLENAIYNQKRKFVGLCRTEDEIKVKKKDIFEEQFPTWQVIGNHIYDIKKKTYYTKKGIAKTNITDQYLVGMIIPVNLSSKYRSGKEFKGFDIVIGDEFQEEQHRYLNEEMDKLFSILETVLRTKKDSDIGLLSNEIDKHCPLYDHIGIVDHPEPGEMFFFRDLKTVYYRSETSEELAKDKKESIMGAFTKNTDYQKFAYFHKFKSGDGANIISKPKNAKEKFNIIYLGTSMGVYTFASGGYIGKELTSGKTFPLSIPDAIDMGMSGQDNEWVYNIFKYAIAKNGLYFETGIIKEIIKKYVGN